MCDLKQPEERRVKKQLSNIKNSVFRSLLLILEESRATEKKSRRNAAVSYW